MQAQQQLIAAKWGHLSTFGCNSPGCGIIRYLSRREDRVAFQAAPASPDLIRPQLGSGIDNLGFLPTLYANHDYILS